MSIATVIQGVLESGQLTQEQEQRINWLLRQEQYTEADLCALDSLCVALFTGQIVTAVDADPSTHAA